MTETRTHAEQQTGELPGGFPPPDAVKVEPPDGGASDQTFANTFTIRDLAVFDDATLCDLINGRIARLSLTTLAVALCDAPSELRQRIWRVTPIWRQPWLWAQMRFPAGATYREDARRKTLDALFWELTYWKTPDLYEELTAGETLHPRIWQELCPELQGKTVLDAGAGSGRATLAAVQQGAQLVYAADPSPGLLSMLHRKAQSTNIAQALEPIQARFDHLPLPDSCVDTVISAAAFTADPHQGGERGLAELQRVTRSGGVIILIWPRPDDYPWLAAHGFHYVAVTHDAMRARYRSLASAFRIAKHFYARNRALWRFLQRTRCPEVPFHLLGMNPPRDYCWLRVE